MCKAVVFPSCERSEAYGITLVEAAMYGRAMISTELNTGTSYINSDGETGLVVEPKNAPQLREAMEKMHHNDDLVTRMGVSARKRYLQLFKAEVMAQRYSELYHNTIKKPV